MRNKILSCAVLVGVLLIPSCMHAMTPLSPRLTTESAKELTDRLTELGFPQVGHNSILIALAEVLGFQAGSRTYDYHEPYPHLPRVQVSAVPDAPGCAVVSLHATYQLPQPGGVRLLGIYCLSGVGQWQAKQQVLTPDR